MIDNWFTNKCMTLVGPNGRALTGDALEAAEQALQNALGFFPVPWQLGQVVTDVKEPKIVLVDC